MGVHTSQRGKKLTLERFLCFFCFLLFCFSYESRGSALSVTTLRYVDSHKANLKLPSGTQEESAVEKRRVNFVCAHKKIVQFSKFTFFGGKRIQGKILFELSRLCQFLGFTTIWVGLYL